MTETPEPVQVNGVPAWRAISRLTPEDVADVDSDWRYPDETTALRGLGSSGVAARARELIGVAAVSDALRAALAPFRQADGTFRIGASCRFLVARA